LKKPFTLKATYIEVGENEYKVIAKNKKKAIKKAKRGGFLSDKKVNETALLFD
jgi:hypothetical protein